MVFVIKQTPLFLYENKNGGSSHEEPPQKALWGTPEN